MFASSLFLAQSEGRTFLEIFFQNTNRMAGHIYDHSTEKGPFSQASSAKGMHWVYSGTRPGPTSFLAKLIHAYARDIEFCSTSLYHSEAAKEEL